MTRKSATIRLGIEGADQTERRLREVGEVGDRAMNKVRNATRPASAGLKAVDGASREAQTAMRGFAGQAGPVGGILEGLGKKGLLAAAGIGAIALGLAKAGGIAREAVTEFDAIGKTADKIGIGTEALQELRFAAGDLAGFTDQQLDTSLQRLSRKMGDAARGVGEAVKLFDGLGIAVKNTDGTMRSVDAVLGDVARSMDGMSSDTERLSAAVKIFDSEGAGMVNVLKDAGSALDTAREQARAFGIVVADDVIRRAEETESAFGVAAKVIDVNLKQAFIDLAPVLLSTVEFFGSLARGLADIRDLIVDVERMSLRGVESGIVDLDAKIAQLQGQLNAGTRPSLKDGVAVPLGRGERQGLIDEITALRIERSRFEQRIAAAQVARSPAALGGGGLPAASGSASENPIAAVNRQILRQEEDLRVLREANAIAAERGVAAAKEFLQAKQDELTAVYASIDAQREAQNAGSDPVAAGQAAERLAKIQQEVAGAKRALADAEKRATERQRDAERTLAEERRAADAAEKERQREALRLDKERLRAVEDLTRAEAQREEVENLTMPVIAAGRRVGNVSSLAELERLRDQIRRDQDEARVAAAGNRAASGAGEFGDAEAMRRNAESIERRLIAEREANELIERRAETLTDEADLRARIVREAEEANARMAEDIADLTGGIFQQAQAWNSVQDALRGVVALLERAGAFDALFAGLGGTKGAGSLGGVAGLFAGAGSDVAQAFGGSGFAPASTPIPIPRRALGGPTAAGGLYEINETGRGEMFRSNVSGEIYALGQQPQQAAMPVIEFHLHDPGPNTRATARMRQGGVTQSRDLQRATGARRGVL